MSPTALCAVRARSCARAARALTAAGVMARTSTAQVLLPSMDRSSMVRIAFQAAEVLRGSVRGAPPASGVQASVSWGMLCDCSWVCRLCAYRVHAGRAQGANPKGLLGLAPWEVCVCKNRRIVVLVLGPISRCGILL